MFNTLFGHTGFAVNVASVFLSMAQIMGGVMSIGMPTVLKGFNYLSPIRYMVRCLGPYSLRPITFTCEDFQRDQNGRCFIQTGYDALRLYDIDQDPALNLAVLGAAAVIYRLLAYVLLKVKRTHWGEKK